MRRTAFCGNLIKLLSAVGRSIWRSLLRRVPKNFRLLHAEHEKGTSLIKDVDNG